MPLRLLEPGRELRQIASPRARRLAVLGGVTERWSSTGEVVGRAGVVASSGVLDELAGDGLVEVTPPMKGGPRWRLTERGAAELRDLPAVVAGCERGE